MAEVAERKISPAVAIGLGVAGAAAAVAVGVAYVWARREEELPPPPPGLASLYGRVVNSITGEAIPGALITLNGYSTYTDTDGYYDFQNLEPGIYVITIEKENYVTGSGEVTLVEGVNELNVSLSPVAPPAALANLYGKVTDATTGEALANAEVVVNTYRTYTDENGYYAFTDLEPGIYAISSAKEFYEDFGLVGLVIVEGDNRLDIELAPIVILVSLTGLVIDTSTGQPIEGVEVTLADIALTTHTDSLGKYGFVNLEPANYTIVFEKEGYSPVTRNIAVREDTWDEQGLIELPPTELVLSFTNPRKHGYGWWDVRFRELDGGNWRGGTPSGIKAYGTPCALYPTENTILLRIEEVARDLSEAFWFGPYLVTIPQLGNYTWNSKEGRINGIKALELPATDNECIISGILKSVDWTDEGWGASILVDGAEAVPGKVNIGRYFIGDTICSRTRASIPVDGETGSPVIRTGRRITCRANLFMEYFYQAGGQATWKFWDFHYYPEYPPEAYEFSGSLTRTGAVKVIPTTDALGYTAYEIRYSVTGGTPPFAVTIIAWHPWGWPQISWKLVGPTSGTTWVRAYSRYVNGWEATMYSTIMYAHPNPEARWGRWTWKLDNWQRI